MGFKRQPDFPLCRNSTTKNTQLKKKKTCEHKVTRIQLSHQNHYFFRTYKRRGFGEGNVSRSATSVQAEKSQQLSDGLPWHLVQTSMDPRGQGSLAFMLPWLFLYRHQQAAVFTSPTGTWQEGHSLSTRPPRNAPSPNSVRWNKILPFQ